jgi:hypothetical protein
MEEFLTSQTQDAPTPITSAGTPTQKYSNAAGDFDFKTKLSGRKVKSRKDSDQPKRGKEPMRDVSTEENNAINRYYGDFSIEAKRNVMDLLKTHPMYDKKDNVRMNRVENNTRSVMPNDAIKTVENGGYLIRQNLPQASQPEY